MITFLVGLGLLLLGYLFYSKFVTKQFKPDDNNIAPAIKYEDGVDYVPLSTPKNAFIQLLNIAGTGPIFGPILGALYGPIAFILIPVGCLLGGAVHDYSIGIISMRNKGHGLPVLSSKYLGKNTKHLINILSILLLLLVGTVFITTPAKLIKVSLAHGSNHTDTIYWVSVAIIFAYYLLATILPVDKVIGKIYPYFGAILTISAIAIILVLMFTHSELIPEFQLKNLHPKGLPILPMFFMTVTCGVCSGFHATQSPIVARTLKKETKGRQVFYGMMILEGVIAMIWAGVTMSLFHGADGSIMGGLIKPLIQNIGGPAYIVKEAAIEELGGYAGIFAVIGVIVLPITSGDTAFRSLRLIISEYIGLPQTKVFNRYVICIPIFIIAFALLFIDFNMLWRYFSWANQTLATVALFTGAGYLHKHKSNYFICLIPGIFMLFMALSYLFNSKIGFGLSWHIAYIIAGVLSVVLTVLFFTTRKTVNKTRE